MRHGTRQLYGERARHGAGHRYLAWLYAAAWPDFAPPLTPEPSYGRLLRSFEAAQAAITLFGVSFPTCYDPEYIRARH